LSSEPPTIPDIIARPTLLFLAGLTVGIGAWLLLPGLELPGALVLALRILGVLCIAAWLGLGVWSARAMRRAGTTPALDRPTTALVQNGPYRYSRNPIYLAIALLYLGINLVLANLWGALLLPVWMALVEWAAIRPEERYLEARFGVEYLAYRKRARRWL
jgi:protein-S-isoprenylcysteine O-methyltransferase Ste14